MNQRVDISDASLLCDFAEQCSRCDFAEQCSAGERKAKHDSLLGVIAEAIPCLVYVADAHARAVYVNRRVQEFSGLPAERVLRDGWRGLLHPEDASRVRAAWRDSAEPETAYENE